MPGAISTPTDTVNFKLYMLMNYVMCHSVLDMGNHWWIKIVCHVVSRMKQYQELIVLLLREQKKYKITPLAWIDSPHRISGEFLCYFATREWQVWVSGFSGFSNTA